MSPIIVPVIVLSGIGLVMAALLAVGRKVFYVEVDERQEKLMDILPGANCGGCGYPGCSGYAAGLVEGKAEPTLCPPGGADLASEIGEILGVEVGEVQKKIALVACAGDQRFVEERSLYLGIEECSAGHAVAGGSKRCKYGCLGLGSCQRACPFDAIAISDKGLAYVIEDLCTGCGQCVETCPRGLISLVPFSEDVHVLCRNPDKAKAVKAVCSVGCTGCKLCAKKSKRFQVEGALAAVTYDEEGDIPDEAALVCATGTIFDRRSYSLEAWLTNPEARDSFDKRRAEYKEAEKAKKAAARKAKAGKKAKAEKEKAEKQEAKTVKVEAAEKPEKKGGEK
jgi:electron transport complex protein RnfB